MGSMGGGHAYLPFGARPAGNCATILNKNGLFGGYLKCSFNRLTKIINIINDINAFKIF